MSQLAEAYQYAYDAGCDVWDFAIELPNLLACGLTRSDLRWLVSKGYVEHACEITEARDAHRQFRPVMNLSFTDRTCFVLTPAGVAATSEEGLLPSLPRPILPDAPPISPAAEKSEHPTWDADRRILRLGDCVVKHFRLPSPNQELILAAFEEEGWPPWIADPLPPKEEQCPKRRLNDTIKSLNRNQQNQLLVFHGDGKGEGIVWALTRDVRAPILSDLVRSFR